MLPEFEIENLSHEELIVEAKQRRKAPTRSEVKLWSFLHNKKMYGFSFRRQAIWKNFIFDFYCPALKLVIDIDFSVDDLLTVYYKDRDEKLQSLGFQVLRFKNDQILDDHKKVVRMIEACVEEIWESKKLSKKEIDTSQNHVNYPLQTNPIPSPSPREGKGTRAAGGMGSSCNDKPVRVDVSRETRNLLIEQARYMRKNPTPAEALLWGELRARKLAGYKFRRQHPIRSFIVDFYCPAYKLIIEIDGPIHKSQKAYDNIRNDHLQAMGYNVLRFNNQQVENHLIDVLEEILRMVTKSQQG